MFLLVSVRHVGAHPDELQHGVSIQSSINLGKRFPRISRVRIIPSNQILARVFLYWPPFILDFICRMVLIIIKDRPARLTALCCGHCYERCIKFQFCINIFLRLRTNGWYVVTKGEIFLRVFFFSCRADCLFAKLTSDNVVCIILWGYPRVMRHDIKFEILSSNVVSEEIVLSSLSASPLIKPLFTPSGWLEVKCVYWKVSVGL